MKNMILFDFPERIETKRLYITPAKTGDGAIVNEAIRKSRNELKEWMLFAQTEQTVEETEENIRLSVANFIKRTDLRLHIFSKATNEFIGSTGFHRIDWNIPKVEIGYWIDSQHAKKGYMTEVVKALTSFAFQHFKAQRVEIRCDEENLGSRKVAEKAGFILEGILRNERLHVFGEQLRNTCIYAVTPSDWEHS